MIPKIVAMIEALFSMSYQYNIALPTMPVAVKETIQGRFDEIVEYIKTLFQFNDIIQFVCAQKNIIIFILLSGIVISMVVLFGKLPKIKALLYPEKVKAKHERVSLFSWMKHYLSKMTSMLSTIGHYLVSPFLWAKRHLLKGDIIVGFLILFAIVGLVLSGKNNTPDVQLPPVPEKPVEAPAPPQEFPHNVPVPKAPAPAPKHKPVLPPAVKPTPKKPPMPDTQETVSRYLKLGNALIDRGDPDYDKAIEIFKRVLVIDPGNEDAIRGIEKAKKANTEHYLNSKEADLVEKRLKEIAKRKEQSLLPEKLETHKGHIYVNSEPPAAAIYINGNYKAKTPAEVSLATGEYTVVLIKDNYKTEAVRLNLKEGMNLPLSVRLSPK